MAKLKKGFSLVELLVIVAVIGILAAIAIPALLDIPDKGETKSDLNTVETLNTRIEADEALDKEFESVSEVQTTLAKAGYNGDTLVPETKDHCFVWDNSENVKSVLMVRIEDDKVVYPERFATVGNVGNWYFINEAPTAENNYSAYPSPVAMGRQIFTDWLNEELPTVNAVFVAEIDAFTFTYNEKEYQRPGSVAYAMFETNATYEDGAKGPRLGDVALASYLRYDLYNGRTETENCIGCYLNVFDEADNGTQMIPNVYFREAAPIERTVGSDVYFAYRFEMIEGFEMTSSADYQYEIRPQG